jgi:hypothetical protein
MKLTIKKLKEMIHEEINELHVDAPTAMDSHRALVDPGQVGAAYDILQLYDMDNNLLSKEGVLKHYYADARHNRGTWKYQLKQLRKDPELQETGVWRLAKEVLTAIEAGTGQVAQPAV